MKDVQATGKPPALQREHPIRQNINFFTFSSIVSQFWPSRSESGLSRQKTMWIRIHNTANITLIAEHIEPRHLQ